MNINRQVLKKIGREILAPVILAVIMLFYFRHNVLEIWRAHCRTFGGIIGGSIPFIATLWFITGILILFWDSLLNIKKIWPPILFLLCLFIWYLCCQRFGWFIKEWLLLVIMLLIVNTILKLAGSELFDIKKMVGAIACPVALMFWSISCELFGGIIGGTTLFTAMILFAVGVFKLFEDILLNFDEYVKGLLSLLKHYEGEIMLMGICFFFIMTLSYLLSSLWVEWVGNRGSNMVQINQPAITQPLPTENNKSISIKMPPLPTPIAKPTVEPVKKPHFVFEFLIPDEVWENYHPPAPVIKNATQ